MMRPHAFPARLEIVSRGSPSVGVFAKLVKDDEQVPDILFHCKRSIWYTGAVSLRGDRFVLTASQ
jgi:hypothetical protein